MRLNKIVQEIQSFLHSVLFLGAKWLYLVRNDYIQKKPLRLGKASHRFNYINLALFKGLNTTF